MSCAGIMAKNAFNPNKILRISNWFDASDINNNMGQTQPANNTQLSLWKDKSGFGSNAVQAVSGKQPKFYSNVVGGGATGLPGVIANYDSLHPTAGMVGPISLTGSIDNSWFFVLKRPSGPTGQVGSFRKMAATGDFFTTRNLISIVNNRFIVGVTQNNGAIVYINDTGTGGFTEQLTYLGYWSVTSGASGSKLGAYYRLNDGTLKNNLSLMFAVPEGNSQNMFGIGNRYGAETSVDNPPYNDPGNGLAVNCYIGDFFYYNKALNTSEINTLNNYLNRKYNYY
jgi:hypothetical protein